MHRHCLLVALLFAVPAAASADVPPPGVEECSALAVGDACTVGEEDGACRESTCGRLDYSTSPPQTVSYACVVCTPGATPTNGGGGCSIAIGSSSAWLLATLAVAGFAWWRHRAG